MTLHTVGTRWGQHYGTMENAFASAWTDLCSKGTEKSYNVWPANASNNLVMS